jgi:chromosomal replication initiator protein DnaA
LAEGKSREVDRYAADQFKEAQERVKNVESALRSEDYETGLKAAETAREALDKASQQARLKKEEEDRLRKEAEERLAEAARIALQAENEGAKVYAEEKLKAYRTTVQEIKDLLVRGEVAAAHKASEAISSDASNLLEETVAAKRRAMQKETSDALASSDTLIEEAEALGAARFLSEKLTKLKELRDQIASLMEQDDLNAAVERAGTLLNEAESLKDETARRKKEEEDFKNRVLSSLQRAEQTITDAAKSGVGGKELKKAEVLLEQAKRAQEASHIEKSLKFSALATRKAIELMSDKGVRVPQEKAAMVEAESEPTPKLEKDQVDAETDAAEPKTKELKEKEEPEVSEVELPSLRPQGVKKGITQPTPKTEEKTPVDPEVRKELEREYKLLPDMTFEMFQVGDVNRFTYQTAKAVVESPGTAMYNPLFVHGSVGVGKTHLINATGCRVRESNADALVIYMSSERFANALVEAIELDALEALRTRFTTVDVLIVDDIQFLAGRERAQEEFSHVFNRMVNQNKQVIISSDRPPSELTTLEERLRSRFEKGFVTDLQLPEAAVREKILKQQTDKEDLDIPDDVIKLFADYINTNVRELQGSLKKLVAHCRLTDVPFSLEAGVEVLRSIMPDVEIDEEILKQDKAELSEEEQRLLEEERKLREEEERLLAEEAKLVEEEGAETGKE